MGLRNHCIWPKLASEPSHHHALYETRSAQGIYVVHSAGLAAGIANHLAYYLIRFPITGLRPEKRCVGTDGNRSN